MKYSNIIYIVFEYITELSKPCEYYKNKREEHRAKRQIMVDFLYKLQNRFPSSNSETEEKMDVFNVILQLYLLKLI